jgi:HlyD family secretion protein
MNRNRGQRGYLWRLGVAVVLAIILAACSNPFANNQSAQPQRTATLSKGTLIATASATGSIQPESEVNLSFQTTGKVTRVNVAAGDMVKKGDVLATLDMADQEAALQQAQSALIVATDTYSRTVDGPDAGDVSAAKAALNAAYASYSKLKAGPTSADIAAAETAVRSAEAALRQAQTANDLSYKFDPRNYPSSPTITQLQQARNNLDAARTQYDKVLRGADNAQLAEADQQIQDAKARLAKVQQPAKQYDIDQALAGVQQAQLQVQQAQRQLDKARLIAPLDGAVSAVNIKEGEAVGASAGVLPAVKLMDLSILHIDITVDEIDIAKVRTGQAVSVTLDALPGVELAGKVDRVASTSTSVNGVVSYAVRVVVDRGASPLRSGMTANASIVLDERQGVLMAPNWAIRRDKQSGKSYLTLMVDTKTNKEVEVKTGLRNDNFSEILSGASAGQTVVAPEAPTLFGQ